MNKINKLFEENAEGLLNIFFTAGYPLLESTVDIAKSLDEAGVKLIEIGMPYSDPLADGATIQDSSQKALNNGMNLDIMFQQVAEISKTTTLTIVLMGYLNQLLTVGVESFLGRCRSTGVAGLIIPDLPMEIYEKEYKALFEEYGIAISFLITPRTSNQRIMAADRLSSGFLYLVADNSITGASSAIFSAAQLAYFKRIMDQRLQSRVLIGFGIRNKNQYIETKKYANGAIIGSEFIRQLPVDGIEIQERIIKFIKSIVN